MTKQTTFKQKLQGVIGVIICLVCIGLAAFAVPSGEILEIQDTSRQPPPLSINKQLMASPSQAGDEKILSSSLWSATWSEDISAASLSGEIALLRNIQEEISDQIATASDVLATESSQLMIATASQDQKIEILHQENADGLAVTIYEVTGDKVVYEVADIQIASADQLKTAFAQGKYGKSYRQYPSKIAQDNQAIIAVNADYCGFRNEGIVIRNGELYRNNPSSKDLLLVDVNGDLSVVKEETVDGEDLIEQGIVQSFSFGPSVVVDGVAQPAKKYFLSKSVKEPRTAIGQIGPLHYVLVTVEGRREASDGMTLEELGKVMADLGCETAYNLDGGGTSTMVYRDEVVNQVSGKAERASSDIVYFSGLSDERVENGT